MSSTRLQTVALEDQRAQIAGTSADWKNYRKAFDTEIENNSGSPEVRDRSHFFRVLDGKGTATLDADGAAWMQLSENGESVSVGVSASNVLAAQSDPQLSHGLLLARVSSFLKSPKHRRETMFEFREDWSNLRLASAGAAAVSASVAVSRKSAPIPPIPGGTF